jgi:hypothetical protein
MNERKRNSSKAQPVFEKCCKGGRVKLPPLPDPPQPLKGLWDGTDRRSADFRKKARKYNSAFAFTSFQYGERNQGTARGGVQAFQIQGVTYHMQGPLGQARPGKEPRFAQLYFYEPDEVCMAFMMIAQHRSQ